MIISTRLGFISKFKTYIRENQMSFLDWPGNSPNLNTIELLWNIVIVKKQDGLYNKLNLRYSCLQK